MPQNLKIATIVVTPFQQNARLIWDADSLKGALVDPGGEPERLRSVIKKLGVKLESIVLTHAHIDHAGAVENLLKSFHVPLAAHREDRPLRAALKQQALMFGLSASEYQNCPEPDLFLEDGNTFKFGEIIAEVRFTPGHAPGHIVLYIPEISFSEVMLDSDDSMRESRPVTAPVLIAGDTLFYGSIGRTDLPLGNHEQLISSIRKKIFSLPAETVVMPGHGANTTVGFEIKTNPFTN